VRDISIFLLSAAPPPHRDTRRARGGRELSSAMEVVAPFPTSRPLPLLSTAPAHHLRLLPPPFVSGRQLHPSPRHQGRERERVARRGRGYRAAMATDGEREGSRSKMRAREEDGEGEGSGERGGRGRKRDAGRAAGRKREPGRGREEEGAERKSECLTIPRGEALNREEACAIESNAARYRLVIPFPNSFDIQTVALVAANSNSEFHPPMPTSKRTLSDFVVQFLACKRFLTRD